MQTSPEKSQSVWRYLRRVWGKARQIENRYWLIQKVGGELVPILVVLVGLIVLLGWQLIEQQRLEFVIPLAVAVVSLSGRIGYCLIRSAIVLQEEGGSGLPNFKISFVMRSSRKRAIFRIQVGLESDSAWAKHLTVFLQDIQSADPAVRTDESAELCNKPLMQTGDIYKTPERDFRITQGNSVEFDVIKRNKNPKQQHWAGNKLFICHAIRVRPVTAADRAPGTERNICGHGLHVREPNDAVPKIPYILTIRINAEGVNKCVMKFLIKIGPKGEMRLSSVSRQDHQGTSGDRSLVRALDQRISPSRQTAS